MVYLLAKYAPKIPKKNFVSLSILDEKRAKFQICKLTGCKIGDITNMIVWGNHSGTMFPNFEEAKVDGEKLSETFDSEFFETKMIPKVR